MKISVNDNTLSLMVGDITEQTTDFIVNAANGSLLGGGGVDGAIHRVAGPKLLEVNKRIRKQLLNNDYLPTGEAVVTKGFNLAALYVIHTVGPVWENQGTEQQLLANCYQSCLSLAYMMDRSMQTAIKENAGYLSRDVQLQTLENKKTTSISFPSISTSVYRFPIEQAAIIALTTIYHFLNEYTFGEVVMTLLSEADLTFYQSTLERIIEERKS